MTDAFTAARGKSYTQIQYEITQHLHNMLISYKRNAGIITAYYADGSQLILDDGEVLIN